MLKRSNKQELIVSCKQEVAFWKARPVAKSFYIHNIQEFQSNSQISMENTWRNCDCSSVAKLKIAFSSMNRSHTVHRQHKHQRSNLTAQRWRVGTNTDRSKKITKEQKTCGWCPGLLKQCRHSYLSISPSQLIENYHFVANNRPLWQVLPCTTNRLWTVEPALWQRLWESNQHHVVV